MSDDAPPDLPDEMFLVRPPESAATTLSISNSPSVLLTFVANRLTRVASRACQAQFGIGAMDWRMLVMLTRAPGSSVSHAARTIGIDKAAVSRSLKRLAARGLARERDIAEGNATGTRSGGWALTEEGARLHERMLADALARQRRLLEGFTQDEVARLTSDLERMLANLEGMRADDPPGDRDGREEKETP